MRIGVIVLLVFLLLGTVGGIVLKKLDWGPKAKAVTVNPSPLEGPLQNPFIGMAPPAEYGPYPQPHRLVYLLLRWTELEPEKGKYAFEAIERKYKFDDWHSQGVRVIIRFVMDYSTDAKHKDIPDWLYEEIGRDGIWYDEEVGKGFSPNYNNPVLIEEHRKAIEALGRRYNPDPRIAYIALGSLGHWGEWHTYRNDKILIPFPNVAVSDQYVGHYLQAFPDKKLLMRRPYPIAKERGIGLYNDVFGIPKSTADFVGWFENGYDSVLAGNVRMPAMPDFWKRAPSGGEFGNAYLVREYLQNDRIGEVIQMAEASHVSWLGPSIPAGLDLNGTERANLDKLLAKMGYRFRVHAVSYPEAALQGGKAKVALTVVNEGVAPFYYDWPLELSLTDANGQTSASVSLSGAVTRWLPGENSATLTLKIPHGLAEGVYRLGLAILDPDTHKPGVEFAMEGRQPDGYYLLGELRIRKPAALERWKTLFP